MHGLSVVIPALDEEESIPGLLAEAGSYLQALSLPYEILVVDDGSRDGTRRAVAESVLADSAIRMICHDQNRGYGASLRHGFEEARYDLLFFTDGDGQFDFRDLPAFLAEAERPDVDLVIGFRHPRSEGYLRRLVSQGYGWLVEACLGIRVRDVNCAFKLIKKHVVRSMTLRSKRFAINAELLGKAQLAGFRWVERDVRHAPRRGGRSTVKVGDVASTLGELASICRSLSRDTVAVALPPQLEQPAQAPHADSAG